MPSDGSAWVISAHSRSTAIGAEFFSTSAAMLARQSATIRADSSANAESRAGLPTIPTRRASVAFDIALIGNRPVHRDLPRLLLDGRRLGGLAELDDVALQTVEIEMRRARRVGERGAPGMPQETRQLACRIDRAGEFGHRRKQR